MASDNFSTDSIPGPTLKCTRQLQTNAPSVNPTSQEGDENLLLGCVVPLMTYVQDSARLDSLSRCCSGALNAGPYRYRTHWNACATSVEQMARVY